MTLTAQYTFAFFVSKTHITTRVKLRQSKIRDSSSRSEVIERKYAEACRAYSVGLSDHGVLMQCPSGPE